MKKKIFVIPYWWWGWTGLTGGRIGLARNRILEIYENSKNRFLKIFRQAYYNNNTEDVDEDDNEDD